jgi:hypothetical protein
VHLSGLEHEARIQRPSLRLWRKKQARQLLDARDQIGDLRLEQSDFSSRALSERMLSASSAFSASISSGNSRSIVVTTRSYTHVGHEMFP